MYSNKDKYANKLKIIGLKTAVEKTFFLDVVTLPPDILVPPPQLLRLSARPDHHPGCRPRCLPPLHRQPVGVGDDDRR